jgi:hypothetical protein
MSIGYDFPVNKGNKKENLIVVIFNKSKLYILDHVDKNTKE